MFQGRESNEKSAVEIGKLLGADLIIIGSVVKIGTAYTINSRMMDVKTGEATLGKNVTGNDLNLLTNLARCWLKDKVPVPRANDCCISGVALRMD